MSDTPLTDAAVTYDEHGRLLCPVCGNPIFVYPRRDPDEQMCVPRACPAWTMTAVFDHDTREWRPVGPDDPPMGG